MAVLSLPDNLKEMKFQFKLKRATWDHKCIERFQKKAKQKQEKNMKGGDDTHTDII